MSSTEHLWSPWRIDYILNPKSEGCPFCDVDEKLLVKREELAFVVMNLYPYNNGHVMVCPNEHTGDFLALGDDIKLEMSKLIDESVAAIKKVMNPDGFNIGMNLNRAAGSGIDDHLHWHIVPRWNGDTNFMPVTGHTKVVCEALEATCKKLREAI